MPSSRGSSHPGIGQASLMSPAWTGSFFTTSTITQYQEESNPDRSSSQRLRCIYSVNKHDMSTCCMPHPALAPGHLGTAACKLQLLCLPSGRTCPHGDPGQKRQV